MKRWGGRPHRGSENKPTSMRPRRGENAAGLKKEEETTQGLEFAKGDRVKIREGSPELRVTWTVPTKPKAS